MENMGGSNQAPEAVNLDLDPEIAKLLTVMLQPQASSMAYQACDGKDEHKKAHEIHPAVVILGISFNAWPGRAMIV